MSRDEQARELARQWRAQVYYALKLLGEAAIHALQNSVEDKIIQALRGASGGGADAIAIERLRIMSKQKLASEMEDHEVDCADWRAGYEHMVSEARTVFATIAPDHPAENAKSSGDRTGAEIAQVGEVERVARAIYSATNEWTQSYDNWSDLPDYGRDVFYDRARAAIDEMVIAQSEVRAALEPFAKIAPMVEHTDQRDGDVVHRQGHQGIYLELTKDDFRRAASIYAALARCGKGEG